MALTSTPVGGGHLSRCRLKSRELGRTGASCTPAALPYPAEIHPQEEVSPLTHSVSGTDTLFGYLEKKWISFDIQRGRFQIVPAETDHPHFLYEPRARWRAVHEVWKGSGRGRAPHSQCRRGGVRSAPATGRGNLP